MPVRGPLFTPAFGRVLTALIAGGLGSLAFAPLEWWWLHPVAIAILVAGLDARAGVALAQGFGFGLGFFLPLLHWSGTYVGALPWIALAVVQAGMLAPWAALVRWISARVGPHLLPVWAAGLWIALEAIRGRFPWGGFGWGRVGFSQVDAPYSALASWGGAALLGFITVLIATAAGQRRWRLSTGALLAVLAMGSIAGATGPRPAGDVLRVAVVQGNVPQLGLDFNAQRQAVLNNHITATESIAPSSSDVIIWPENASDIDPLDDPAIRARLTALVDEVDAPIMVGAVLREQEKLLNAALLWTSEGPKQRYVKRRLAPFGEYLPLRGLAEAIVPAAKRVIDFTAGSDPTLFQIHQAKLGVLICFEVLYDDLGRDLVRDGATVLVAQTNSATFGTSPESHQQLQMTRLRAIEHRRPIASASTSGISALIDHRGRVLAESEFFTQVVLARSLQPVTGLTIADRIDGWGEAALIILPLMTVWLRRRT